MRPASSGPCVVALFAGAISSFFEGYGQEIFNAVVLLVAVLMLAWHHAWMAKHGRELAAQVRSVGQAVAHGERPAIALAVVCGVAILREGSEVVLFLYGIAMAGSTGVAMLSGGLLGVVCGALVAGLSYLGLLAIPQRYIFSVTGWLITLLAAGMAAQAVYYLNAAGVLSALANTVWDTSAWLPQDGAIGLVLHTVVGYVDRPTLMQLVAYLAVIVGMVGLARFAAPQRRPAAVRSAS